MSWLETSFLTSLVWMVDLGVHTFIFPVCNSHEFSSILLFKLICTLWVLSVVCISLITFLVQKVLLYILKFNTGLVVLKTRLHAGNTIYYAVHKCAWSSPIKEPGFSCTVTFVWMHGLITYFSPFSTVVLLAVKVLLQSAIQWA